jgi:AGZA family xanthine/uracil permease-like MFS transporter
VPAIAYLVNLELASVTGEAHIDITTLSAALQASLLSLLMLGNGFVITSMVWVALLVWIIDRRFLACLVLCAAASLMTLVGLMHSPFADGRLFWPDAATPSAVFALATGYLLLGLVCLALGRGPLASESGT